MEKSVAITIMLRRLSAWCRSHHLSARVSVMATSTAAFTRVEEGRDERHERAGHAHPVAPDQSRLLVTADDLDVSFFIHLSSEQR